MRNILTSKLGGRAVMFEPKVSPKFSVLFYFLLTWNQVLSLTTGLRKVTEQGRHLDRRAGSLSCVGRSGFYPDPAHLCVVYYLCSPDGSRVMFECPIGKSFDIASQRCIKAGWANCEQNTVQADNQLKSDGHTELTTLVSTSPKSQPVLMTHTANLPKWHTTHAVIVSNSQNPSEFSCKGKIGYIPDPNTRCNTYYYCDAAGKALRFQCPMELAFDKRAQACVLPHKTICRKQSSSSTNKNHREMVTAVPDGYSSDDPFGVTGAFLGPSKASTAGAQQHHFSLPVLPQNSFGLNHMDMITTQSSQPMFQEKALIPNQATLQPVTNTAMQATQAGAMNSSPNSAMSQQNFMPAQPNVPFGADFSVGGAQGSGPVNQNFGGQPAENQMPFPHVIITQQGQNQMPMQPMQQSNIGQNQADQGVLKHGFGTQMIPQQEFANTQNGHHVANGMMNGAAQSANFGNFQMSPQSNTMASGNFNNQNVQQVSSHNGFIGMSLPNGQSLNVQSLMNGNQQINQQQPVHIQNPNQQSMGQQTSGPFFGNFVNQPPNQNPVMQADFPQPNIGGNGMQQQAGLNISPPPGPNSQPQQSFLGSGPIQEFNFNQNSGRDQQQMLPGPSTLGITNFPNAPQMVHPQNFQQPQQFMNQPANLQAFQSQQPSLNIDLSSVSNKQLVQSQNPPPVQQNLYSAVEGSAKELSTPSVFQPQIDSSCIGVPRGFYPMPGCREYFYCSTFGERLNYTCQLGMLWNAATGLCEEETRVACPSGRNASMQVVLTIRLRSELNSRSKDVLRINGSANFDCAGRTGTFPDSSTGCKSFLVCRSDGQIETYQCVGNMIFSATENVCVDGTKASCIDVELNNTAVTSKKLNNNKLDSGIFTCSNLAAGRYANVDDGCRSFWICDELGRDKIQRCPDGLVFDNSLQACTDISKVDCTGQNVQKTTTMLGLNKVFSCNGRSGFFADQNSQCRNYYYCTKEGKSFKFTCPLNFIFSEDKHACDSPEKTVCVDRNTRSAVSSTTSTTTAADFIAEPSVERLHWSLADPNDPSPKQAAASNPWNTFTDFNTPTQSNAQLENRWISLPQAAAQFQQKSNSRTIRNSFAGSTNNGLASMRPLWMDPNLQFMQRQETHDAMNRNNMQNNGDHFGSVSMNGNGPFVPGSIFQGKDMNAHRQDDPRVGLSRTVFQPNLPRNQDIPSHLMRPLPITLASNIGQEHLHAQLNRPPSSELHHLGLAMGNPQHSIFQQNSVFAGNRFQNLQLLDAPPEQQVLPPMTQDVVLPKLPNRSIKDKDRPICPPGRTGFFPNTASDCRNYVFCEVGTFVSDFQCPPNAAFNETLVSCDTGSFIECQNEVWAPTKKQLTLNENNCFGKQSGYYSNFGSGCREYYFCAPATLTGFSEKITYKCPETFLFDEYRGVCVEFGPCVSAETGRAIQELSSTTPATAVNHGFGIGRQFDGLQFDQPSQRNFATDKPRNDIGFSCREAGNSPDFDTGCSGFWSCKGPGDFATFVKCPSGKLFDPAQGRCMESATVSCVPVVETNKKSGQFSCTGKPTGFYADNVEKCRKFHHCTSEGEVFTYTCPFDWIFHEILGECVEPENHTCPSAGSSKFAAFDCFGRSGFYADYSQNCQVFHFCRLHGSRVTMSCPPTMIFDENEGKCLYKTICTPPVSPTQTQNQQVFGNKALTTFECPSGSTGYFGDPQYSCRLYWQCVDGLKVQNKTCPGYLRFNATTEMCEHPDDVTCLDPLALEALFPGLLRGMVVPDFIPGISDMISNKIAQNQQKVSQSSAPFQSDPANLCDPDQIGYYADLTSNCRSFYHCSPSGNKKIYTCPGFMIFNESLMQCQDQPISSCISVRAPFMPSVLTAPGSFGTSRDLSREGSPFSFPGNLFPFPDPIEDPFGGSRRFPNHAASFPSQEPFANQHFGSVMDSSNNLPSAQNQPPERQHPGVLPPVSRQAGALPPSFFPPSKPDQFGPRYRGYGPNAMINYGRAKPWPSGITTTTPAPTTNTTVTGTTTPATTTGIPGMEEGEYEPEEGMITTTAGPTTTLTTAGPAKSMPLLLDPMLGNPQPPKPRKSITLDPTKPHGVDCAGKKGYFLAPGTGCKGYVYCKPTGVTYGFTCPGEYVYNDDKEICDWPENVICMTASSFTAPKHPRRRVRSVATLERPTETTCTTGQFGYFADTGSNCSKFFFCSENGTMSEYECPHPDLKFDQARGFCDWGTRVLCGNDTISTTTTLPATLDPVEFVQDNLPSGSILECPATGFYSDYPSNCTGFYFCGPDGSRLNYTCPDGQKFDTRIGSCLNTSMVTCLDERLSRAYGKKVRLVTRTRLIAVNGETSIDCRQKRGLFADPRSNCQNFFYCSPQGLKFEYSCPTNMAFNNAVNACDELANSSCAVLP